jgi:SAM-dependent methyltransferase
MFRATRDAIRIFTDAFAPAGPVLELGAFQLLGLGHFANPRPLFEGLEYVGTDIRAGPGVDRIEDAQDLSFEDGSFRTVLVFDTLEHLPRPGDAAGEARRVLRDDGLVVVSVPCSYRLHGFPSDFWRFSPSGLHALLRGAGFEAAVVFALGPRVKPALVFAVASPHATPEFSTRSAAFRRAIEHQFRRPASRLSGHWSVARELAHDGLGWILGRARLDVAFYDPTAGTVYDVHPSLSGSRATEP